MYGYDLIRARDRQPEIQGEVKTEAASWVPPVFFQCGEAPRDLERWVLRGEASLFKKQPATRAGGRACGPGALLRSVGGFTWIPTLRAII